MEMVEFIFEVSISALRPNQPSGHLFSPKRLQMPLGAGHQFWIRTVPGSSGPARQQPPLRTLHSSALAFSPGGEPSTRFQTG